MLDQIKRAMFAGIGMAVMTKDRVEELARDLASQANLSEQEGRQLVEDVLKRSDQAQADLREQVNKLVGQATDKIPVVSRAEYDKLAARVAALEAAAFRTAGAPAAAAAAPIGGDPANSAD